MRKENLIVVAFFAGILALLFGFIGYQRYFKAEAPPVVQKLTDKVLPSDTVVVETVNFADVKAKKSKDYVVTIDDAIDSATASKSEIYFTGKVKEVGVSLDTPEEKVTDKKATIYVVKFKDKGAEIKDVSPTGAKAVLKNKTAVIKVKAPEKTPVPPAPKPEPKK
ncbi:MAG: hypothetical protein ACK5N8_05355 [Alphaproteobacteria bacterium]